MEDNNKYNGWSNYETWRVNLEIVDGYEWSELDFETLSDLAEHIEEYVKEIVFMDVQGLERGVNFVPVIAYAQAFLDEVNYDEIARSVAEDYPKVIKQ